jgi:sulfur-oxidizing protein SoxX
MQSRHLFGATALAALLAASAALVPVVSAAAGTDTLEEGKELAFDRAKGNCLACHVIAGGVSPGNIGPPLIAMKARFPEREKLREQIWDPMVKNPQTVMPPYGHHQILTVEELEKVVDFIWSL